VIQISGFYNTTNHFPYSGSFVIREKGLFLVFSNTLLSDRPNPFCIEVGEEENNATV
jgi:hypothetical protein